MKIEFPFVRILYKLYVFIITTLGSRIGNYNDDCFVHQII